MYAWTTSSVTELRVEMKAPLEEKGTSASATKSPGRFALVVPCTLSFLVDCVSRPNLCLEQCYSSFKFSQSKGAAFLRQSLVFYFPTLPITTCLLSDSHGAIQLCPRLLLLSPSLWLHRPLFKLTPSREAPVMLNTDAKPLPVRMWVYELCQLQTLCRLSRLLLALAFDVNCQRLNW